MVLPEGWRLAGSLGTGFRAPTVYQLASVYGVRTLRPERSRSAELALRWAGAESRASITMYRNEVKDLIGFGAAGPCASPFGCYVNVSRALLRGLSLKADGQLDGGFSWRASLDRSDPVNSATGKRLARRAAQQARVGLTWTSGGAWTWGASLLASGDRYDDAANTRRLGGYAQLDLDARWQWARGWALEAQVVNATDRDYALARGYAVMPRSLLLGLRAQW
jgi:vitamin B12 transporter